MAIPGLQAGQARLGRYELLARLATGGMGEIFLARLEGAAGFEKLYVVKRILPHLADDTRFRQMLISEARIASLLSHANICQVYELGETDGQLYIVMEYLEGITMLPLLRKASKEVAPLDLGFIAGMLQQVCDALHYAHELRDRRGESLGIVHRDVTPSNVFLTDAGVAKVLDFGIAKAKGASANTQTGTVKGKYAYMAPEQLRGGAIDRRVDVFALGVVTYEMVALRRLFQRKTDYLTFRAVMEQPIPDVRRYRPDAPDAFVDVLMHALDRDPNNRFETARQFGTALLDSLGSRRPWSQGELSDYVRANFADDIGKRSKQVASAVQRTASGLHSGRSTMPLIAQEEAPPLDDDDDDGFPSVETEVDARPDFVPQPAPRSAGSSMDFAGGGTPPPFGVETTGSAPSLQPLRGNILHPPSPNTVIVHQPRSLIWPILAVAMIGIAAAALFLVWQKMQETQPVINIQQSSSVGSGSQALPAGSASNAMAAGSADLAGVGSGSADVGGGIAGGGSAGGGTGSNNQGHPPPPRPDPEAPYRIAIARLQPKIEQCLRKHPDQVVKGNVTVTLSILATGVPDQVELEPVTVSKGALGDCMRQVLRTGSFPKQAVKVRIPFSVKTS
jgi:serine/threonine protein kinase